MFREDLKRRLEKIFGMKVSYNDPGSFEQDTIFVEILQGKVTATKGWSYAKVTGSLQVFTQTEKMPYGFFAKRINSAGKELTGPLHFQDIDTDVPSSQARTMNIHERRCGFLFLFKEQYDVPKPLEGVTMEQISLIEDGTGAVVDISGSGQGIGVDQ